MNTLKTAICFLSLLALSCCRPKETKEYRVLSSCPTIDVYAATNASLHGIVKEVCGFTGNLHIPRIYMICLEEAGGCLWLIIYETKDNFDIIKDIRINSQEIKGCIISNSICFFIISRMKKYVFSDFFSKSYIKAEINPYDIMANNRPFYDDESIVYLPDSMRVYKLNKDSFEHYITLPGEAIP